MIDMSISQLMAEAEKFKRLHENRLKSSIMCQAKKRAQVLGIPLEEYLKNKPGRGRPKKVVEPVKSP